MELKRKETTTRPTPTWSVHMIWTTPTTANTLMLSYHTPRTCMALRWSKTSLQRRRGSYRLQHSALSLPRIGANPFSQFCFNDYYSTQPSIIRSFGTSRQNRVDNDSDVKQTPSAETSGSPSSSLQSSATSLPSPSPLIILPKPAKLLLPHHQQQDDSFFNASLDSSLSSSVFLASSHATDLYDPHTHLMPFMTASQTDDYEAPTPLWTHVLLPLLSVLGRPISTADYMRLCLTHPEYGYYIHATTSTTTTVGDSYEDDFDRDAYDDGDGDSDASTKTIIGADFVTAPEVSQVFGECLGIWFATHHLQQQEQGETRPWQWVECGPGKGSLMKDLIQFQAAVPEFDAGCRNIHFVEASPVLRQLQREALLSIEAPVKKRFVFSDPKRISQSVANSDDASRETEATSGDPKAHTIYVYWHDSFTDFITWQSSHNSDDESDEARSMATYCIGQEFLDALPVYSFQKADEGYWRERMVSLPSTDSADEDVTAASHDRSTSPKANANDAPKPRLVVVLAPEVTPALRTFLDVDDDGFLRTDEAGDAPPGSIIEVNPEGILLVQDMARLFQNSPGGGAALLIDYGQRGSNDSIRAFSKHKQLGFLSHPGQVDITADVDFVALEHAVNHPHSRSVDGGGSDQSKPRVRAYGPVTQGDFLMAMGMQERVMRGIEDDKTTDQQAEDLYQAMVRLASPEEMGERYKVLCILRQGSATDHDRPPGFE